MTKLLNVKSSETLAKIGERFGKLVANEHGMQIDPQKFVSDWKTVIDEGRGCFILAVEDGSDQDLKAAGIIGGVIEPCGWTHKIIYAREYVWWVTPNERGKGIGETLINAFTNWARQKGATKVIMASLREFPQVEEFYKKQGFELIEKLWGKGV